MRINNETRKDPKTAREVLERLLPDARARKICLRYLCDSIQLTHQLAPSSWGLTLQRNMLRLNVGHIEVVTIEQGRIHKVVAVLQVEPVQKGESTAKAKSGKVDEEHFIQHDGARRRLGKLAQDIAIQSEQKKLREVG